MSMSSPVVNGHERRATLLTSVILELPAEPLLVRGSGGQDGDPEQAYLSGVDTQPLLLVGSWFAAALRLLASLRFDWTRHWPGRSPMSSPPSKRFLKQPGIRAKAWCDHRFRPGEENDETIQCQQDQDDHHSICPTNIRGIVTTLYYYQTLAGIEHRDQYRPR
jgi:hypothetical protein